MKTTIFFLLFLVILVSSISNASSYLGKAPESGIIISVNPEKIPSKSNETVLIKGSIKYVKKSAAAKSSNANNGNNKKSGLLEEFNTQGIEITGSFPSAVADISSQLNLKSVSDSEIEFSYLTSNLRTDDPNQFALKIFNNHSNKDNIKKLSVIQAKLDKRIQLLANLKQKHEGLKSSPQAISVITKEIAKLNSIITKISNKMNADENLIAENTYALQINNLAASDSSISTVMNNFRFAIQSHPGSAIQGSKVSFKSQIVSLMQVNSDTDSTDDSDGYLAEFQFNNQILSSQKIVKDRKEINAVFDYVTAPVNPSSSNIFSVALYHLDDADQKGRRIGYINLKLPVIADGIKPIILSDSVPNHQDRYSKQLRTLSIKAQDSFGQIDPAGFKISVNNQGTVTDLSNLISSNKIDDSTYEFTGNLNPLEEGEYTLTAKVSDEAGNQADPFSVVIRIDRTVPVVNTTLTTNTLTNKTSIEVPITVTDLSPTATDVYVNNELVLTTALKAFSVSATLSIEGNNNIRIESKDAAGNVALTQSIAVTRDTTPPVISNLTPSDNTTVQAIKFLVSGESNEPLIAAKVNGMNLSLSSHLKAASGTYYASEQGPVALNWSFTDLASNTTNVETNINIQNRLLVQELVSVDRTQNGDHLLVSGKISATRPGIKVTVSFGYFGFYSFEAISADDGSFNVVTDFFTDAELKVTDLSTGESETIELNYAANTTISGIVKDTAGNPLPGVTVSILNGPASATTNASGAFQFDAKRTGDQTLVIDGTTVQPTTDGFPRTFSESRISINIGIGQNNALARPIYLQPIIHDGTETKVSDNTPVTVESPHAPGVVLQVPANATVFPDGTSSGSISIVSISSDVSTIEVPKAAVPDKVIALEPSGLSFKERVQITLPNDNELPPGTEMIIMSMNSKKGIWEVDGRAKVSESGNSVVSEPGEGISHFSLVYAVPIGPIVSEVKDPGIAGVDISQGAMSTSLSLPYYMALGNKITPSLTYKSSWANPTAVVSNIFDIPTQEMKLEYGNSSSQHEVQRVVSKRVCGFQGISYKCWDRYTDYYIEAQINDNFVAKIAYSPASIQSQFFISAIASDKIEFHNSPPVSAAPTIEGATFNSNIASPIVVETGIPNRSLISYAVSLKNPESQNYLESGLYPTMARYKLKLKSMTLTTSTRSVNTYVNGSLNNVQISQMSNSETRILDQVFPSDVISNVIVQNKVSSPFGRGWNLNFTQRILNPSNNLVVIEEADGSVSTYALDDTITTVADGNVLGVSFSTVGSLTAWPKILTVKRTTTDLDYVHEVEISTTGSATIRNKGLLTVNQGFFDNSNAKECYTRIPRWSGTYGIYRYDYRYLMKVNSLVEMPNGKIIGFNETESNVFSLENQIFSPVTSYRIGNKYVYIESNATISEMCGKAETGMKCYSPTLKETVSCDQARRSYISGSGGQDFYPYHQTSSGGEFYAGYWGDDMEISGSGIAFNGVQKMVLDSSGNLIIADTGNNRIRKLDLKSAKTYLFAGDGGNTDAGDNGPAKNASIFHPKGLAFDSSGNLYISTENGYIRKVDPSGIITTFAGRPIELGGTLSNEVAANQMAFLNPSSIVIDDVNNYLYVADTGNNRVVRIDMTTKMASTVAGNGLCKLAEQDDNKAALSATICSPTDVGLDADKNLLITDSGKNKIRRVIFKNTSGGMLSFAPTAKDLSKLTKNIDGSWTRKYRDGRVAEFDSEGLQILEKNRLGNESVFKYVNKNLSSIKDPSGQETIINYSGDKIKSIVDPAGRTTQFSFTDNLLTTVTFPDGSSKKFQYDQNGLLTAEIDARDATTTYEYNNYNRLTKVISPNLQITNFNDQESKSIASANGSTLNPADLQENGHNSDVSNSDGSTTKYVKDINGFVTNIKDVRGRITKIQRDIEGRVNKVIYPDLAETTFKYDLATNDLLETFDVQNSILQKSTYNNFGQITSWTDGNNQTYYKDYDPSSGLLIKERSPIADVQVSYLYTSKGLVSQKIQTKGSETFTTEYSYDNVGNLTQVTEPDGKIKKFYYNEAGNIIKSVVQISSTELSEINYEYDEMNRLRKVVSPKGEVTEYTYYSTGQLHTIVDPSKKTTTFEINSDGQLLSKTLSTGEVHYFQYNSKGKISQETDPNGNTRKFSYNEFDQLIKIELPDDLVEYEYDFKNRLISAFNKNSKISYSRDSLGRITIEEFKGMGDFSGLPIITKNYIFDKNGNKTQMSTNNNITLSYSYDTINRLSTIGNSFGDLFSYSYDNLNRLTKVAAYTPGLETNYKYTRSNLVDEITHKASGIIKSQYNYSYDLRNLITQKRDPASTENYTYDKNGQLTGVAIPGSPGETFTYDSIGNRSSDDTGQYSYNLSNQRLVEDFQFVYSYDNNGNLIAKTPKNQTQKAFRYEYTSLNQLKKVIVLENSFGSIISEVYYEYDVLGRRMSKRFVDMKNSSNNVSTGYHYDGSNMLFEYTGDSHNVVAVYTHSIVTDDLLSVYIPIAGVTYKKAKESGNFYFWKDRLGSISSIVDASGTIRQKYQYSGFGKILKITDASNADISVDPFIDNQFTFTGREYDKEINTYYYRARHYDPNIGRFLQQDPNPGTISHPITIFNKYIYGGNNPISITDPSGASWLTDIWRGNNGFVQDVAIGLAVAAILYFSGGTGVTFAQSLTAVLSAAGGAAVTAGIQAGIRGGDFWKNFEASFHFNFRLAAAFLAIGGIYAGSDGVPGGNGFQGSVTNSSQGGGSLSFGSATYFGETITDSAGSVVAGTVAQHEFGRYIQYNLIMAIGAKYANDETLAATYLIAGGLDGYYSQKSVDAGGDPSFWYELATWLGTR